MDFLSRLFLESQLMLGAILAVAIFVLLVHWRRTLKPRPLLIGLAVSIILLIVQAAVVTRRERADIIMTRIEKAVLVSKADGVGAEISARFRVETPEMDRARFVELVRVYMQRVDVRTLARRKLEVVSGTPERFEALVSYFAEINAGDYSGPAQSRWRIIFVKEADRWRIISIEPTMLNRQTVAGWRSLH